MIRLLFIVLVVFLGFGCKPTKSIQKPDEKYNTSTMQEKSILNIPVSIQLPELAESLNQAFSGVLYEDDDVNDGDNIAITASKAADIVLTPAVMGIRYQIPLSLLIKYKAGFAVLNADGDITLDFLTTYTVNSDWVLETKTVIEQYQWQRKPGVKLAGIRFPVQFIGDMVMAKSREFLAASIDDQIKKSMNLKQVIDELWTQLFQPSLVSPAYNTWLLVNPQAISMSKPQTSDEAISFTISVESKPSLSVGLEPDYLKPEPLPAFAYAEDLVPQYELHLYTVIPYEEAEQLAKSNLLDKTFESGKYSATIKNIHLFGQEDNLVVNTVLDGSYKGSIYMTGQPVFNEKKNSFDLKNLKFTLETKNFLHKSAAWLLKSTLKKQIKENVNVLLQYNMSEMEKTITTQLEKYEVRKGIDIHGDLEDFRIENAFLSPRGFNVELLLSGNIFMKISGLGTVQK